MDVYPIRNKCFETGEAHASFCDHPRIDDGGRTLLLHRFMAVLLAAVAAMPAVAGDPPPLVLATYAYAKYDRAAALRPLAEHLATRLGAQVDVVVHESPRALAEAIRAGRVDLAATNTFVFLAVRDDPTVHAGAVFDVPAESLDGYRGVLVARRERVPDMAALLQDAFALRYAQVLPGSTSGGLVQDLYLASLGVAPSRLADRRNAGTHDAALAQLDNGTADIAALAEEPWRLLRAHSPDAKRLVELWRSPPIPPGPIVCRDSARISCGHAASILRTLDRDAPAAFASLAAAWSEAAGARRLVAVDDDAYDALTDGAPHARGVIDRALAPPPLSAYQRTRKQVPRPRMLSQSMRPLST